MKLHFRMLKDDDDVTNKEVTLTQFLWVLCAQTQNMFDLASGTRHNLSLRAEGGGGGWRTGPLVLKY